MHHRTLLLRATKNPRRTMLILTLLVVLVLFMIEPAEAVIVRGAKKGQT